MYILITHITNFFSLKAPRPKRIRFNFAPASGCGLFAEPSTMQSNGVDSSAAGARGFVFGPLTTNSKNDKSDNKVQSKYTFTFGTKKDEDTNLISSSEQANKL